MLKARWGSTRGIRAVWACCSSICLASLFSGCQTSVETPAAFEELMLTLERPTEIAVREGTERPPEAIASFCGDCHALPQPGSFERDVWYDEVRLGFEMYARSGRTDLTPPTIASVVQYYRQRAPLRLEFPEPPEVDQSWAARFETTKLDWLDQAYITPAVASVQWLELMAPGVQHLVACDMRDGSVSLVDPNPESSTRTVLARLGSPSRVAMCDLDEDGWQDLIVADLGSMKPFEHGFGQIVWLRRQPESETFEPRALVQGLGRVSDVVAGDFNDDGALDIVAAEFGHRLSGGIRLLTNTSRDRSQPTFAVSEVDQRPGTVQLVPQDWNRDGHMDIAAVISQEYEAVELFLGGENHWKRQGVWQAPDLTFGSVGATPADLDGDGDMDLLYVNGDTFDNNYANPAHGLQWLENQGQGEFAYHRLLDLPGAYRAVAADFDGDDDLDIVAVANLPRGVKPLALQSSETVSIVVLEQIRPLEFATRVLERGTPRYPALECGDFDQDGRVDFAVGAQLFGSDDAESAAAKLPRLTVWWNRQER
ncbi:FG-GAP repeat domain-containing protein [Aureliella helgolandensis]|nr:VCBS repeat-containing protein [Aureliella helgolandensis]